MAHIDELFKDSSPVDTVNRIIGILSDFGVSVSDTWYDSGISNCYSLRVSLDGTSKGTNGKGVTKELARASGYAEFMERLQSGHLSNVSPDSYTDAKHMTAEELFDSCSEFYEKIAKSFNLVSEKKVTSEKLMKSAFSMENNPEKITALPYYDVMNDSVVYLPLAFVRNVYGTNGLAAGNSIDEAIVQGFSEIVERYAMKMIFVDRLTPPTVPDEVLAKYETAYKTITNIREAGNDVVIKDCSIGLGYPVVATVFLDRKKHKYQIHLGSSPVFEIALERSLTEGFQGRNISNVADVSSDFANNSQKNVLTNLNRASRNGSGAYPREFFLEKGSYPLIQPKDYTGLSNKELLREVLSFAKRVGCSVYVRNMSYLGFDTYKIIVPEWSELYFNVGTFTTDAPYYQLYNSMAEFKANLKKASMVELSILRSLIKIKESTHEYATSYGILSGIPVARGDKNRFYGCMYNAYIAWEFSDIPRVLNCISKAMRYDAPDYDKAYISCINKIQHLISDGSSVSDALNTMAFLYDKEITDALTEVYEKGINPFAVYITECTPDDCSLCRYIDTCTKNKEDEISVKLSNKIKEFDTESAYEKVVQAFRRARS